MKTIKLQKFVWVFFALALGTTSVFAQGWKNGNRVNIQHNGMCLEQISGLTEEQKTQIWGMAENHQTAMAELRNSRRETVDAIEKNEIRGNMLKKVESLQTAVKNLLSVEQQKQYDLLHVKNNNFRNQNFSNQKGNGFKNACKNNYGQQQFARGNGKGCKGNKSAVKQGNKNGRGCKGKNIKRNGCGNRNGNKARNS